MERQAMLQSHPADAGQMQRGETESPTGQKRSGASDGGPAYHFFRRAS